MSNIKNKIKFFESLKNNENTLPTDITNKNTSNIKKKINKWNDILHNSTYNIKQLDINDNIKKMDINDNIKKMDINDNIKQMDINDNIRQMDINDNIRQMDINDNIRQMDITDSDDEMEWQSFIIN